MIEWGTASGRCGWDRWNEIGEWMDELACDCQCSYLTFLTMNGSRWSSDGWMKRRSERWWRWATRLKRDIINHSFTFNFVRIVRFWDRLSHFDWMEQEVTWDIDRNEEVGERRVIGGEREGRLGRMAEGMRVIRTNNDVRAKDHETSSKQE